MDKGTSRKYGHYGYTGWSVGNQLEREKNSCSTALPIKALCDICGKPRGKLKGGKYYNHERCAKIRQAKYAKEKA